MTVTSNMTLKQWYKGITVPRPTSRFYHPFIASCVGIVNKIVERELERTVTVKFGQTPTAYADQDNSLIVISEDFAKGDFTEASGERYETSEEIIPQILGVIVHEAAHFAFSPKDLTIIHKGVEGILGRKVNQAVVMRLGNVIEDIYIEAEVANRIPQIAWMLDRLNENLLGHDAYQISSLRMAGQIARPVNVEELGRTIFHLIFAKIHDSIMTTPYIDNLFELAQSARDLHTIEERTALVAQLYELIMVSGGDEGEGEDGEETEETEDDDDRQVGDSKGKDDQGSEGGDDGDEKPGETQGSPSLEGKEGDDAVEGMPEEPTVDHGKPSGEPEGVTDWQATQINEMIRASVDELKKDGNWKAGGMVTKNRVTPEMANQEMEIDVRYAGLAKIGRQRATANRPYGIDQRRGHSIRKLHRIATDGRIFAEPMQTQSYKPMEVIILVDCSGSMQWGNQIHKAGAAVIGAAAGLKDARCEVQITGHTADVNDITLTLYTIKEWNDPITVASRRMKRLTFGGSEYKLCQNRDHLAIEEVAKDFRASNAQRRRLMIVVSDGSPAALNGYFGDSANKATRKVVEDVRAQGIDVTSISITEEAMTVNDFIYGRKNNVCNEDPNVIAEIVKQLIMS